MPQSSSNLKQFSKENKRPRTDNPILEREKYRNVLVYNYKQRRAYSQGKETQHFNFF
uniref:Uncharacterized protein n=1 Tax=Arundo donax TaxID=35708 RepID=A0A0A9AMQ8_ARUDO